MEKKSRDRRERTYPLTWSGWSAAWADYAREDPAAAKEYLERLRVDERVARISRNVNTLNAMPKFAVVPNCVLKAGYGTNPITVASGANLHFVEDSVIFTDVSTYDTLMEISYADLLAVHVAGPGAVTTGGGFIGGGFGTQGAAEGILMASVLNALTTRTKITTVIEIQDSERDFIWISETATPEKLRTLLMPVFAKMRSHAITPPHAESQALSSPIERMKRLTELHNAALITDEEYELTRKRILDSI